MARRGKRSKESLQKRKLSKNHKKTSDSRLMEVGNRNNDERVEVESGDGEVNGQADFPMAEEEREYFQKEIQRLEEEENEQLHQELKKQDLEKMRHMPWRGKLLVWLGRTLPELRKKRSTGS